MQEKAEAGKILGAGGPLAAGLAGYEERSVQIQMAEAVEKAFLAGHNLVVEAGTGVGKSFAYLVPAVLEARNVGMRVLISTHTISLQEQLTKKDVPFLKEHLGLDFEAVLVKGRRNYLCIRRLVRTSRSGESLFDDADALRDLGRIIEWAYQTTDGSLSDLEPQPRTDVWEKVCSDRSACRGARCAYYHKCFFQNARKRAAAADIIIANHSIFFSNLALSLGETDRGFLPACGAVVFDEAHSVENVASEHLGLEMSNISVSYLLNGLYNPRTDKGFLKVIGGLGLGEYVENVRYAADAFFSKVADWLATKAPSNGRVREQMGVSDTLSEPLRALAAGLRALPAATDDDEMEIAYYADRCVERANTLEAFIRQCEGDFAYWVERGGRHGRRIILKAAPVSVAPYIQAACQRTRSVVFTSATLAVGADRTFEYFRKQMGLDGTETLKLGSPFDYRKQVWLHIPPQMPLPTEQGYVAALAENILECVKATSGRAFVLFTSYSTLNEVYELAAPGLEAEGITCYRQGGGLGRWSILAHFKEGAPACIFGTDSFWQGVDVPGEALSNVIITRLPFPVPDRPLVAAKFERIRQEGHDPFKEYSLPEAVLKFRQGFGRLIRTATDRGVVVVLDRRIISKWYGKAFRDSIPECSVARSIDEVRIK